MNRRGLPIWLLRDFPAFLGVMISFWPLMILVITNGFKAMRGKAVPKSAYNDFPALLAHAEARLDFAIWREAYRRLGWDPQRVKFTLEPSSDDWEENAQRFQSYQRASRNLEACARAYVEALRQRHNIAKREAASAFRHAPVRTPLATHTKSSLAVRRGRWIAATSRRDGGGCVRTCARGPPLHAISAKSHRHRTSARPRLRPLPRAQTLPQRTKSRKRLNLAIDRSDYIRSLK